MQEPGPNRQDCWGRLQGSRGWTDEREVSVSPEVARPMTQRRFAAGLLLLLVAPREEDDQSAAVNKQLRALRSSGELEEAFDAYQEAAREGGETGDWSRWADCFTEDARAAYSGGLFSFEGRAAIMEFLVGMMDRSSLLTCHRVGHPARFVLQHVQEFGTRSAVVRIELNDAHEL